MKLVSWNVNSLKVRLEQVLEWFESSETDVLALQETKMTDEVFPHQAFTDLGLHVVYAGQKTYNGVAVISRYPIDDVVTDIDGLDDPQRRILAVTTGGMRLIDLYVPNGSDLESDKYVYKLNWLKVVTAFIEQEIKCHEKLAVVGDFNIAPEDCDVHNPERWEGKILVSAPERDALQTILDLGLTDSYRMFDQPEKTFSWWDYRMMGFRRNAGLRIDLVLLSDALKALCAEAGIDKEPRKAERPSDHAPVWVSLNI